MTRYWIWVAGGRLAVATGTTLENALAALGLTIWHVERWGIVE